MNVRGIVAGSAIALVTSLGVIGAASADDSYPIERPEQEVAGQGAEGPTEVAGVRSGPSGVSQGGGLADTGSDLAPLWGGAALLLAGGGIVLATRRRNGASA